MDNICLSNSVLLYMLWRADFLHQLGGVIDNSFRASLKRGIVQFCHTSFLLCLLDIVKGGRIHTNITEK